jgi:hypothetical protein
MPYLEFHRLNYLTSIQIIANLLFDGLMRLYTVCQMNFQFAKRSGLEII